MSINSDEIIQKITDFDISTAAAIIYLELTKSGPQGIMELTKRVKLGRNVVYRLLDELQESQLVSIAHKTFGKEYTALQATAFETILADRELQVQKLKSSLTTLATSLESLAGDRHPESKIVHFEGKDGLKQVNWNLTKAKGEFRVYEQSHVDEYLDKDFSDRLHQKYIENGLVSYDLTNRTSIRGFSGKHDREYWQSHSHYRYISPDVLDIQFEMYMYNDVVTLLDYTSKTPHSIEIHNAKLAKMQKQIYDAVWSQAQEMKIDPSTGSRCIY
jgi:sugar-specific transcriptional regulator TrmB